MAYIFLIVVLHWSWEGGFVNAHLFETIRRYTVQYAVATKHGRCFNRKKKKQAPFTYLLLYPKKRLQSPKTGGDERRILRASAALNFYLPA